MNYKGKTARNINPSYSAIIEAFTEYLQTLGFSTSTCYNYPYFAAQFLKYAEEKNVFQIDKITEKTVSEYFTYLENGTGKRTKKAFSTATLNSIFKAIDQFLEFLHKYGLENLPFPTNRRIRNDNLERVLKIEPFTQEEIKTLYDCIPSTYSGYSFETQQARQYDLKLILTLLYGCGLRRTEAFNLQNKDVDFDKKTVFVRQGKNYKDRIIPMSSGVYEALQDYIYNLRKKKKVNHNRLFLYCGECLLLKLKRLQKYCNNENIKKKRLYPHILRHSIATHLLQNGMSVENIAKFLGHSSLDSTQIYTHILNKENEF
jgi:integrase/recombinase XerD